MNKVVLFRKELRIEDEMLAAKVHFDIIEQRAMISRGDFIIPRYSFLPYAKEFEKDVELLGGTLINSFKEHIFAADIQNYYDVLEEYTFKTWFDLRTIPYEEDGPFVVKGRTNSKKFNWNTKMYAKNKKSLAPVIASLYEDPLIAAQDICVRKYTPLQTFMLGENGLPITNEWRSIWYKGELIDIGYYWQSHFFDLPVKISRQLQSDSDYCKKMLDFLAPIARLLKDHISFVCIDGAFKENGEPVLVEINDACMSGLSCINPDNFYSRLKVILDRMV